MSGLASRSPSECKIQTAQGAIVIIGQQTGDVQVCCGVPQLNNLRVTYIYAPAPVHVRVQVSTAHRVRGLRVQPFSMTPPCRQPHSVFGGKSKFDSHGGASWARGAFFLSSLKKERNKVLSFFHNFNGYGVKKVTVEMWFPVLKICGGLQQLPNDAWHGGEKTFSRRTRPYLYVPYALLLNRVDKDKRGKETALLISKKMF